MFGLSRLAVALTAGLIGRALTAPVITVHPGDAGDIVITKDDTVNATTPAPVASDFKAAASGRLAVSMVNNFPGGSVNAYVTGLDSRNRLVMLKPDGTFYYPTAAESVATPVAVTVNCALPLGAKGKTTTITIPGYISSARIWFAAGTLEFYTVWNSATGGPSLVEPSAVNPSDPSADVNWGFVELTNTEEGGLYANISYVDFVGLILGMSLTSSDGSVQIAEGLRADAVSTICSELKAQGARDGQPWSDLCMVDSSGKPLRVIAPSDHVASNPTAFDNYWSGYIDKVWTHYTTNQLTINTQAAAGEVNCTVSGSQIQCADDNRAYAKPTAGDIFGCNSGPFGILDGDNDVHKAVVPRLCAAFHRGTLLKTGGHIQPGVSAAEYYTTMPSNWYSKLVHKHEADGKGYAFPYDDVNPSVGIDQAGVVADASPVLLTVTVGGPLSSS